MRIPKHIAIIPDGNRRWATQHQMEKKDGYQHGLNPGLEVLRKAKEYGVAEITYYGFTVDNCKRPKVQQNAFKKACVDAVRLIQKEGNVSLLVVGDSSSVHFPEELLKYTQRKEIGIADIKVNFLVNYGWEWDLSAIRKKGMEQENDVMTQIHSKDISRIDLVIRWGNMRRLSGYNNYRILITFCVCMDAGKSLLNKHGRWIFWLGWFCIFNRTSFGTV